LLCIRLLAVAEETLAEFLSKATGTAVDWVQMIGMKVSYLHLFNNFIHVCSYFCFLINISLFVDLILFMFLCSLVRILLVSLLFLAIVVG
jgi:hypothetical protein